MVRLPGGRFQMGADWEQLLARFPDAGAGLRSMMRAETPRREVTIEPFWMDRCEVTNLEFQRFVDAMPQWRKQRVGGDYLRDWNGGRCPAGRSHFPVAFITWNAAAAYAEWAGKRLPHEAEWEFAARGGQDNAVYPWGSEEPSPRLANYGASGHGAPVRVGSYPANPYGLFDLAGNVWEFCVDEWRNPAGAGRRVIRGGSFAASPFNLRITARDSHQVDHPVAHVGFRCAASAR